jgi:serine/threonine protein kinase/DNA-directed RNA polymerase subunit RPC12/RpoP
MNTSEFKQCPNGHYYQEKYQGEECPYCDSREMVKIKDDTTWTPISFNANDLYKEMNIILQLDAAPDYAKRFIRINRNNWGLNLKNQIASCIGCEEKQLPEEITDKTRDIDNIVKTKLLEKNIVNIKTNDNLLDGDYYLCDKTINSIIPDTLLTQILGKGSKLDLLYKDVFHNNNVNIAMHTGVCASFGDEEFQKAKEEIESKKYLAISLLDNSAKVLCLPDRENYTALKSVEKFCSEEISIFNPKVVIKKYSEIVLEDDFNTNTFIKHLTEVANNGSLSLYFKVSRQQVAVVLATMFNKLSELHKNGFIHCDLKPQNILCFKDGLTPFDPINVRKGEISVGMTTNFCAPEQILTLPVSPATDIYNLGLIILSIIDGIVYGKTSNYIIPTGGDVKNIKILTEPMIFLDYDYSKTNIENKEGIPFWKSFLEKCLAFEQRNRFPNMESFMNEYNRLIELYPLKNEIEFKPNFGNLSLVKINGEFEAAWFV